ncbi:hypothetical protein CKO15_06135 [Halorhodospira abdelmalekii]|uniref:hypothetical protein n=1 Tax=Halorhodospira abdelmalekii TaxID=421629 RepID=UPI0019079B88|nr:hypothetical protein [Halorhodospira abdelmalekii]MBK1734875.1 hypothetical protein [Halorhodospira abdelmalekii]
MKIEHTTTAGALLAAALVTGCAMIQEDERDDVEYSLDTSGLFEVAQSSDEEQGEAASEGSPDQADSSDPPPLPDALADAPRTDEGYVMAYDELAELDVDTAYNRVRQAFDYETPAQRPNHELAEDIGLYHHVSEPGSYYSMRDGVEIGHDRVILQVDLERERDQTRVQAVYHAFFAGWGRPEDHEPWPSDPEGFERNLIDQLEAALVE